MRRVASHSHVVRRSTRPLQSSSLPTAPTRTPSRRSSLPLLPGEARSPTLVLVRPSNRRSRATVASGVTATQIAGSNVWTLLLSAAAFILGLALSALAVAAIPAALELRRTAKAARHLMQTLEKELPDTVATMRLTGMEMSEAIQEVNLLSADLTRGLRASARLVQQAEGSLKQGARVVHSAATQAVLPAVRARVPAARGVVEDRLKATSNLKHSGPSLLQMAVATKLMAKRIRFALAAADVLGKTRAVTRNLRRQAVLQQ